MNRSVYHIAEVANVHGGDFNYLNQLIGELKSIESLNGIKFQPLHPDKIALPDFKWYPVYKELFFDPEQWKKIIGNAADKLNIWIDTFDEYSVQIIRENISKVFGIKLQASILYNENVFQGLKKVGLHDKKIILNISGLSLEAITEVVQKFSKELEPEELILQVGYQAYPTLLEDSGLSKIKALLSAYDNRISFADHLDGRSEEALLLPGLAMAMGAELIEKHVMLEGKEAKYDHFSSIYPSELQKLIKRNIEILKTLNADFIVVAEEKYLKDSRQVPVANKIIKAGSLLNYSSDLDFRRSNLPGLTAPELKEEILNRKLIAHDIPSQHPIEASALRKAKIAAVIACRLKSSRLKRKALLNIGDISSTEMCIKNTMRIPSVDQVVLATSDLEEDAELKEYTYHPSVFFHKGDPLDVIQRYLGILTRINADVLVRITADMPYVSSEITEFLLDAHFATGADYTRATNIAVGTAPEIINVAALKKVKEFFPRADYSEYMTFYFMNNPDHFSINSVNVPDSLSRDYRLTLDYQEDLDLFNAIERHLFTNKMEATTLNIFKYLDEHPEVSKLNSHITLRYKTDQTLIDTLNKFTTIK